MLYFIFYFSTEQAWLREIITEPQIWCETSTIRKSLACKWSCLFASSFWNNAVWNFLVMRSLESKDSIIILNSKSLLFRLILSLHRCNWMSRWITLNISSRQRKIPSADDRVSFGCLIKGRSTEMGFPAHFGPNCFWPLVTKAGKSLRHLWNAAKVYVGSVEWKRSFTYSSLVTWVALYVDLYAL